MVPHSRNAPVIGCTTLCSSPRWASPCSFLSCSSWPGCCGRGRSGGRRSSCWRASCSSGGGTGGPPSCWPGWSLVAEVGATAIYRAAEPGTRRAWLAAVGGRRRRDVRGRGPHRPRRRRPRAGGAARRRSARAALHQLRRGRPPWRARAGPDRGRRARASASSPWSSPARWPDRRERAAAARRPARRPPHPRGEGVPPADRRPVRGVGGGAVPRHQGRRPGVRRSRGPQRARRHWSPSTASRCSCSPCWPATRRWPSAPPCCSASSSRDNFDAPFTATTPALVLAALDGDVLGLVPRLRLPAARRPGRRRPPMARGTCWSRWWSAGLWFVGGGSGLAWGVLMGLALAVERVGARGRPDDPEGAGAVVGWLITFNVVAARLPRRARRQPGGRRRRPRPAHVVGPGPARDPAGRLS